MLNMVHDDWTSINYGDNSSYIIFTHGSEGSPTINFHQLLACAFLRPWNRMQGDKRHEPSERCNDFKSHWTDSFFDAIISIEEEKFLLEKFLLRGSRGHDGASSSKNSLQIAAINAFHLACDVVHQRARFVTLRPKGYPWTRNNILRKHMQNAQKQKQV